MQTLVVLPTYEEAQTIDEVLLGIRGALPAAFILVVDDGSPDGTAERAESAARIAAAEAHHWDDGSAGSVHESEPGPIAAS